MPLPVLILQTLLLIDQLMSSKLMPELCSPIHAEGHGVQLICCNQNSRPKAHCQYSTAQYCAQDHCLCRVGVSGRKLRCSLDTPMTYIWRDHKKPSRYPFSCQRLGFPNQKAKFSLSLREWVSTNGTSTGGEHMQAFLYGMQVYNVTSLSINFEKITATSISDFAELEKTNVEIAQVNVARHFPMLRYLRLNGRKVADRAESTAEGQHQEQQSPLVHGVDQLGLLEVLIMSDIDFPVDFENGARFAQKIQRIEISGNGILESVPRWFLNASSLHTVSIRNTKLTYIGRISGMGNLRRLRLPRNRIQSLMSVNFHHCPRLEEIDLSDNQITDLAVWTFRSTQLLRFLDLSRNPLTTLPDGVFQTNLNLQSLSLSRTNIRLLSADHLIGLISLTHLSAAHCFDIQIEAFALLALKSLQTLDLRHCNLTTIPVAVTQACELRNLWLSSNLLHSKKSFPPEVLVQLSNLRQFTFEQNPLTELPSGLFLLPKANRKVLDDVLNTLMLLPVWWNDICSGFMWYIHLVIQGSSQQDQSYFARKLNSWNGTKLSEKQKKHCRLRYIDTMRKLVLYRELETDGRCEAARRLRSLKQKQHSFPSHRLLFNNSTFRYTYQTSHAAIFVPSRTLFAVSLYLNILCLLGFLLCCFIYFGRKLLGI